jgi:preprotein translocase subunit Sec61beta
VVSLPPREVVGAGIRVVVMVLVIRVIITHMN